MFSIQLELKEEIVLGKFSSLIERVKEYKQQLGFVDCDTALITQIEITSPLAQLVNGAIKTALIDLAAR